MSYALVAAGAVVFGYGFYRLFIKDILNRIQFIERLRIYWLWRDVVDPGPAVARNTMRQTAAPYWRGEGWSIRIRNHTLQFGRLSYHVDSLESQIGNGWYDFTAKEIRKWL